MFAVNIMKDARTERLDLKGISPVGKMQAPRKPWEKDDQAGQEGGQSATPSQVCLDQEFPPVEDEVTEDQRPEGVTV
jgi:hypothetical protein